MPRVDRLERQRRLGSESMHSAATFPGIRDAGSEREYPAKSENLFAATAEQGFCLGSIRRSALFVGNVPTIQAQLGGTPITLICFRLNTMISAT